MDIVIALRLLRRHTTHAVAVIATLAVGIGAASAMFAVVHGVLLRPLPIRDQNRVVVLRKEQLVGNETLVPFSVGDFRDFARQSRTLESVAGVQYDGAWPASLRDGDRVLTANAAVVSGELFSTLGIRPALGRTLGPSDDVVGGNAVVVSHAFWQRELGGDSAVIGRSLLGVASDRSFRIVGVMARGFAFPGRADVWIPVLAVMPGAASNEGQWPFNLVGRLRPGATIDQARGELASYLAAKTYEPGEPRDVRPSVRSIESLIVGDVRPALVALAGAVTLLLVLANVNVANLALVRGVSRARELAVRAAIGGSTGQIVRLLLTEAAVLATLGGIAGVVLASWLLRILVTLAPAELPRLDTIGIDGPTLLMAAAMAAASVLVFSLWPAIGLARRRDQHALRSGSRAAGSANASQRGQRLFVVAQVALAIMVLVGAGLLGRTVWALEHLDMGYASDELETVELSLPASLTSSQARLAAFYESIAERFGRLPGRTSATVALLPPFSGANGWDAFITAEDQNAADAATNPAVDMQVVLPTYFSTMGVPIRSGRSIATSDREDAPAVAVVSRSLAARVWPGEEAIGKRFKFGHADAPSSWTTVVGIVDDVRYRELREPRPVVFVPWVQKPDLPPPSFMIVRGHAHQRLSTTVAARLVREADPAVVVTGVATLRQRLTTSLARPRFDAMLLGAFAAAALALAAIGVYGVIASIVRQRTREIGIRLALGAQARQVQSMVLGTGLALAGAGALIGLVAAGAAARLLGAQLYGVGPADPATMVVAALILLLVAAVACWLPARAATRVDPLTTLQAD